MKLSVRNIKFAWKHRHFLWKYRNLIRHRREIAGIAAVGGAIAAGMLLRRAGRTV